ncbi:16S rRNA (guanine(966)-N(2))-methyltransferase RsmD [Caloramator australicus]|uniref:Ribosomal RNA small subunit methyltransferase D n=1 Tax=Caloramator australicus RC3 TaxID=857293 RepID=I7LKL3_9CLOT|nr:16S rRNA (guanine(966)-N(2))-methyltransferase RsmD [Caloramator australicus]CCJ34550.1 Ribosomal RNA small subunit methyltransferase D [Caloramator australicus RC3]
MRIITGEAKGRIIKAPEGMNTRPTLDRVKESVFNIISNKIYDAIVLDMFAGSGNLGLEAISRGAKFCTFIEKDKSAYKVLKENIKNLNFEDRSKAYFGDSFKIIKNLSKENFKYDLIFLDPPYGRGMVQRAVEAISENRIYNDNTFIISELDEKDDIPEIVGIFKNFRTEKYGRCKIIFWVKEDKYE